MFSTFLFIKINIYTTASMQYLGKLLNKDPQFEVSQFFTEHFTENVCPCYLEFQTLNFVTIGTVFK